MSDLLLRKSFLEVAESGTISRAAGHLFVTQPALSQRLQQLEQEPGAILFERTPRGVALTEEGRYVRREARVLSGRHERLKAGIAALTGLEAGTVRIGGGATAVSFLLPEAIASFQRTHPGVLFQVEEAPSRHVERDVAAERLELGIVTLPIEPTLAGELEVTPLVTDRILLVATAATRVGGVCAGAGEEPVPRASVRLRVPSIPTRPTRGSWLGRGPAAATRNGRLFPERREEERAGCGRPATGPSRQET